VWVPTLSELVVKLAVPELKLTVPNDVELS
jgi:hypothetical protein